MKIFLNDLKRIFSSPKLYIAVLFVIGFGVLGIIDLRNLNVFEFSPVGGLNLFIVAFILGSPIKIFIPLIAVLVYSQALFDDIHFGEIKYIAYRMPMNKYLLQRALSTMLAGGISVALPLVIALLSFCIYDPTPSAVILSSQISILKMQYYQSLLCYCMVFILNAFIFGALYSLISMSLSIVIRNKIIALSLPALYFLLIQGIGWLLSNIIPSDIIYFIIKNFLSYQFFDLARYETLSQLFFNYSVFIIISITLLIVGKKKWVEGGN